MKEITINDRTYQVDDLGFLAQPEKWHEDFAAAGAAAAGIFDGLTPKHWEVIRYIRQTFHQTGKCPLVYQTCKAHGLRLRELKALFPTGYLRGACKLAGITYRDGYVKYAWTDSSSEDQITFSPDKTYQVDAFGFLVNPADWDEQFASCKAAEMKIPGGLTERHWVIINFLRRRHQETRQVPTVYETCESNKLELDDLERLFPDGYHRGLVKIAGLRVR